MSRLKQMSLFAHIVETGSISATAEKLSLSKSVVSQHLKILEQELNLVLFKRTTRKLMITEAGQEFYQYCKQLNNIAETAWQSAQSHSLVPSGKVKITAPHALVESVLAPAICQLMEQYPKIQPELTVSDSFLDFMENNIDVAIRVGQSPSSNLKQKRIGAFSDVLCGQKQLLDKYEALQDIPYIANAWQKAEIHHQFFNAGGEVLEFNSTASCQVDSLITSFALIKSGAGIGLIPDFFLNQTSSEVINAVPDFSLQQNNVYALHAYQAYVPKAIEVTIDAIEQQFSKVMSLVRS